MPFGAEWIAADETVRFRVWAPKAQTVQVRFGDANPLEVAMANRGGGWFEAVTGHARPGTQYQLVVDGQQAVPDPASRYQPLGVHGPSEVLDPEAFEWSDASWRGRQWREAVVYELHVGVFSEDGTYSGVESKLDYLADLGVTAIELMPLASFPGARNWGYDGVLPYAPASPYGRPDDLKRLIDSAHARNLMVLLDVVFNHFGPEGNYLWAYAPQFFSNRHPTPWGQAINFDGPDGEPVRQYFIQNALYWLEEYHFDGLRLDAVHAIVDDSTPDFLTELAETVRARWGNERHVHLVLENEHNAAHYLRPDVSGKVRWYDAQWNDDIHHAMHVLLTGETDGFYADYSRNPAWHLGRCLAEGFSYQGDPSIFRQGQLRGEPSKNLPPTSFVSFMQNHDQVGNRAFGERIDRLAGPAALKAAMTVLLLAPSPPLIFMGEEFATPTPFLFFCDFGADLAKQVRDGRRREFARFEQFAAAEAQEKIPDPNSEKTFLRSKMDWSAREEGDHAELFNLYRALLAVRREHIVPKIEGLVGRAAYQVLGSHAVRVDWPFLDGSSLLLLANLGESAVRLEERPQGRVLFQTGMKQGELPMEELPPHSVIWLGKTA